MNDKLSRSHLRATWHRHAVGTMALATLFAGCSDGGVDSGVEADAIGTAQQEATTCIILQRGLLGDIADASLRLDTPATSLGGSPTSVVGASVTQRLALMQFDLGPVGPNKAIISATLRLRETSALGAGTVNVHLANAAWNEHTVTWNSFNSAFAPSVFASFASVVGARTVDVTTLVSGWYDGSLANNGIVFESSGPDATFGASDNTAASQRPALTVCYDCAPGYSGPNCTIGPCQDGVQNGNETDVDCGGPVCGATCAVNQMCATGADCASGNCCAGTCSASACVVGPLATGQPFPLAIAVDATTVYWGNLGDHTVYSMPIGGGASTLLSTTSAGPYAIALNAGNVFWSEDGLVQTVPKAGGATTQFGVGQPAPRGIAADAANVYWANYFGNAIMQCAAGGCGGAPAVFGTGQNTIDVALDATNVHWLNGGDGMVLTCPKTGCPGGAGTLLATGGTARLATDGVNVYFTQANAIAKVPVGGGATVQLATGLGQTSGIATDGVNVYWTELGTGVVQRCAIGGCANAPTTLASGLVNPNVITVDGANVYFTDTNAGNVWQLPK